MNIKLAAACAFLTILSACGGGGGGGSGDAAQTAKPAPKPVTIDAEGDSTMLGAEVGAPNGVTPNSAPAVLQNLLQAKYGSGVTVENRGVHSAAAFHSLQGIAPYYSTPFANRIGQDAAQIVIENYAINDSRLRTTDQYGADLTAWINAVKAAGKTPVLEEPHPVCDPNTQNLDGYVAMIRVVAQQTGVTLIPQYDYIKSLPNWQSMLGDCLHPNDALYAIKAQREADVLGPIVAALR